MSNEFDDKELFDGAMADAPVAEAQPEQQPQAAETESQMRDERGRFATAEQPEAQAEQPQPEAHVEEADKPVPGKRFGEVTRARDEAVRRAEEAERRAQEYEARLRALEAPRQPQPAAQPQEQEDPTVAFFNDPEGFLRPRDAQNQQAIGVMMVDMQPGGRDNRIAAYQAFTQLQTTNPHAYQVAAASIFAAHPLQQAQAMVEWHKSHLTQQKVGSDPDAFFARTLEERLTSDPAFAASLVEKLTGQARQAQPAQNGKPLLNLPPSLSRATSAAPAVGNLGDTSDAAIFADALR